MLRNTLKFLSQQQQQQQLPAFVPAVWVAGLNYTSHAKEVGLPVPQQPIFCMKSPSSLMYPPSAQLSDAGHAKTFVGTFGRVIHIPRMIQLPPEVDYEGELAIVLGGRCSKLTKEQVVRHFDDIVAGFTCAMDITARRWQGKKGGGQWCVAKSFDTFTPLGPSVVKVPLAELPGLTIRTLLNGKEVQKDTFSSFIFDVPELISFLSTVSVLHPGTVILTGTPAGVGFARKVRVKNVGSAAAGATGEEKFVPDPYYLVHGDELEVKIDKIGSLSCRVEHEGQTGPRLPI